MSHDVALSAINASTIYISFLADEPEVMSLQVLLTPMLHVIQNSLNQGNEDVVIEAFDMFQECAAMTQPLINEHIQVHIHSL